MSPSLVSRTAPILSRSPSHRQVAARRRLAVACAIAILAIASGLIGSLVRPAPTPPPAHLATGPFSYFPTQ
jgi:hypothetical protein